MEITTIGLDLAKNVFPVHDVNERGKAMLRKQLRREQPDQGRAPRQRGKSGIEDAFTI